MLPICKFFVPNFQFEPYLFPEKNYAQLLAVAKLLATNAKLTAEKLSHRKLSLFDPIVHDNSCQIRACRVIRLARKESVINEAKELRGRAAAVEQRINRLQNKSKIPAQEVPFSVVMEELQLSLEASEEMIYLLQTHFLTVGKEFQMNRDGSETATIRGRTLADRLSKQIPMDALEKIVDFTQVKLAEASVMFIQRKAARLGGGIGKRLQAVQEVVPRDKKAKLKRPCSLAFYNFKTSILRAREKGDLILVKKYCIGQDKPEGIFYRPSDSEALFTPLSKEEIASLSPKEPIFVVEGFLPKNMGREELQKLIEEKSLLELALINAAKVPQYGSQDFDPAQVDEVACEEIGKYRRLAEELGCDLQNPRTFTIVHVHAASVEEELGRLV